MLTLYRAGRQADALAAYRDARRALLDGFGLEPGTRLRALETAILRHEVPPPPQPPDGPRDDGADRRQVTCLHARLMPRAPGDATDPEVLRAAVGRFHALMRTRCARHGGTVVQLPRGRGAGGVRHPRRHEDDALRAVRVALEIRDGAAMLGDGARIGDRAVHGRRDRLRPPAEPRCTVSDRGRRRSRAQRRGDPPRAESTQSAAWSTPLVAGPRRRVVSASTGRSTTTPAIAAASTGRWSVAVGSWRRCARPLRRARTTSAWDGGDRDRRGRHRQVAPGRRAAGRAPRRHHRARGALPTVRGGHHLPAAARGRAAGLRRPDAVADGRRSAHSTPRSSIASPRRSGWPRGRSATRRRGRFAGSSPRFRTRCRWWSSSMTCTGPSRDCSTCSTRSPGRATPARPCWCASPGPSCSNRAQTG